MKKNYVLIMGAVIMFIFSGCSKDNEEDTNDSQTQTPQEIKLKWVQSDNINVLGDGRIVKATCNEQHAIVYDGNDISHYYHLLFGCYIEDSPVFYSLSIDIKNKRYIPLESLKIGETFKGSEVKIFANYNFDTYSGNYPRAAHAESGVIDVIDNKTDENGDLYITLNLSGLKFISVDGSFYYIAYATIKFKLE